MLSMGNRSMGSKSGAITRRMNELNRRIGKGHAMTRKTCKWADVKPDKIGRRIMRKDGAYKCLYEIPELNFPLPASVRLQRSLWPPYKTHIDKGDCSLCLCHSEGE